MAITIQTTYSTTLAPGFAGMVVSGEETNRISRTVEDAAGIAFGSPVFRGTGDHGCTAATVSATAFLGVTIADAGQVPGLGGTADTVAQYGTVGILNEGPIYVSCSTAATAGQPVYVTSANVITNVSTANTLLPAHFDGTIAAAGIVPIRVIRQ